MKRKIALSLVAIVAMVGSSFAGIGVNYDWKDLGNGLIQFRWYAWGSDGDMPHTIDGVCTGGGQGVHNVALPSGGVLATVFDTDWFEPLMDPALKEYDTHFITPPGGYQMMGVMPEETNDGANPAGLPAANAYMLPYLTGLGTLSSSAYTTFTFTPDPSGQTYFLQTVVTLEDAMVGNFFISGWIHGDGIHQPIEMPLILPEPGTVAMLVFGGLCLIGIRLRKKIFSNR